MKPTKDKAEFTSGPWIADGHDGKSSIIVNSKWGAVCRVVDNGSTSHRDANARLISQAPAMLEALEIASMKLRSAAGVFGTLALNNNLTDAQRYAADQANKEAWDMHAEIESVIARAKGEETT